MSSFLYEMMNVKYGKVVWVKSVKIYKNRIKSEQLLAERN